MRRILPVAIGLYILTIITLVVIPVANAQAVTPALKVIAAKSELGNDGELIIVSGVTFSPPSSWRGKKVRLVNGSFSEQPEQLAKRAVSTKVFVWKSLDDTPAGRVNEQCSPNAETMVVITEQTMLGSMCFAVLVQYNLNQPTPTWTPSPSLVPTRVFVDVPLPTNTPTNTPLPTLTPFPTSTPIATAVLPVTGPVDKQSNVEFAQPRPAPQPNPCEGVQLSGWLLIGVAILSLIGFGTLIVMIGYAIETIKARREADSYSRY